jgi:iron(III) transport system ATP-binding protein
LVKVYADNVWKIFGKVVALRGVSLEVREGELITLLGPSGCGKTTLLRVISGLYIPSKGRVFFDSEDVTEKPPWKRNVGLVFQDYALWPNLTVFDNIAYGMKLRKVPKDKIQERVMRIASLLRIEDLLGRYPHQLSGGQQQRVALARAVIINPDVLLLDEPLSNLDAKVRVNVRTEIRKLQKELKITSIYVTHDQEEALVLSDRVAVMNEGLIDQIGSPMDIYYNPKTLFVADFVGQVNMLKGKVNNLQSNGMLEIETEVGAIQAMAVPEIRTGDDVYVVFRPENIEVFKSLPSRDYESTVLDGIVDTVQFLGNLMRIDIRVSSKTLRIELHNPVRRELFAPGDRVYIRLSAKNIRVLKSGE